MSQCNQCCKTPCECMDCAGTGRVPDVEATLRAENATLRESLERALVCLYGADATLDDARKVSTVEATLRAELDAVTAQRDELREAAAGYHQAIAESTQIGSFGRRATALARLVAALETAQ